MSDETLFWIVVIGGVLDLMAAMFFLGASTLGGWR